MPNHVTNTVFIEGPSQSVQVVRDLLVERDKVVPSYDFFGSPTGETELFTGVDFGILVPMPEGLATVVKDSHLDRWLAAHKLPPANPYLRDFVGPTLSELEELKQKDPEAYGKQRRNFELAKRLYEYCGFYDWYEWSIAKWGTKWNAYQSDVDRGDNEIVFLTAWSTPSGVWQALSEKMPRGVSVTVNWEDEGGPRGIVKISRGHIEHIGLPEKVWSEEFDCWEDDIPMIRAPEESSTESEPEQQEGSIADIYRKTRQELRDAGADPDLYLGGPQHD